MTAEEITIVFRTDREVLERPPSYPEAAWKSLALRSLGSCATPRSTFGPYIGVYLGAPALFEDQPVFHLFTGMKTDFGGTVAGREVLGMPLQLGDVEMGWKR